MLRRRLDTVFSVCSETGDTRTVNQDRVLARRGMISGHHAGLFLVADGCGGMAHGEAISQLLADSFLMIWEKELPKLTLKGRHAGETVLPTLVRWVGQINESAYSFGKEAEKRVGSTLTVLLLLDDTYYILNVGDSRAYLYRKGQLCQLTEDQSLVADLLRNREITPEEVEHFQRKNVLTMCVGYFETVRIFQASGRVRRGDVFLLCSDGLYHGLDGQLEEVLPDRVCPESAKTLRDSIPPGQAMDNVSAVLVQAL